MSSTLTVPALDFELPPERIATGPPEARGLARDGARLLVSWRSREDLVDTVFSELPRFLVPGDVLVVNTSATLPAAVPADGDRLLHLSTELPGGLWVVELRRPCGAGSLPLVDASPGPVALPGGGEAHLLAPFPAGHTGPPRLWFARLALAAPVGTYLASHGRPIRYGCGDEAWPMAAYQTVFARHPGSAEMPSAARGFTPRLVTGLVAAGIVVAPVTLHTGVSSLEAGEPPYPERFSVPPATAELVNGARAAGHRVVAVGTTATRALETTADETGRSHPGQGWTDVVVSPARGVRVVDGLLTGWHEAQASHLQLLEAVGGPALVRRSYRRALAAGYHWHEFGDFHLVLP